MPPLPNQKHERFAQALAVGNSQIAAAAIAGYGKSTSNPNRLAKNPKIVARVQELVGKIRTPTIASIAERADNLAVKRLALNKEVLAREMLPLAMSNVANYLSYDDDEHPYVDLARASREELAAVQSVQIETYMDGRGKNARPVKRVKFTLHPKVAAAMGIARLFGWIIEKREDLTGLEERLRAMTPEQRIQDAEELYERARARLIEDQREQAGGIGEGPIIENEPMQESDDNGAPQG